MTLGLFPFFIPSIGVYNNQIRGFRAVSEADRASGFGGRSLTFLCDANGAAAHPDSQAIHSCIDQVFGLSCSHHCRGQRETETLVKRKRS